MPDLAWTLRRLHAMSPAEIIHRTRMALLKKKWQREFLKGKEPSVELIADPTLPPTPHLPENHIEAKEAIAEAEAYLRHEWLFFGLKNCTEATIDWHVDPTTQARSSTGFGFAIDHRQEANAGNVKVLWEKSRHHHLTVLGVAHALTGDARFRDEVITQLNDWITANPYMAGVHWTHPLEQGIRLISWVYTLQLVQYNPDKNDPLWKSLYQHQLFIENTYSRGSSANNHLIGEMAGLFIATCAWPVFSRSAHWRQLAQRVLEKEIQTQTFASGLNKEMAFSYHIFCIEFFLLAWLHGEQFSAPFSPEYKATLSRMIEALDAVCDETGSPPRYGDGDDGMALQLQAIDGSRTDWLFRAAAHFLKTHVPIKSRGSLASAALGVPFDLPLNDGITKKSVAFADAGFYIIRSKTTAGKPLTASMDCGPHGFLSIAAHAHADALHFNISVAGQPIFVDPGTYVYTTEKKWRAYFRSTHGHNTLEVDRSDQARQAGTFLWSTQPRSELVEWKTGENGGAWSARHFGYERLGITHTRKLIVKGGDIEIRDQLDGANERTLRLAFHFHPDCQITLLDNGELAIKTASTRLSMTLPDGFIPKILHGAPEGGWYSPQFGVKIPAFTIFAEQQKTVPAEFVTRIKVIS